MTEIEDQTNGDPATRIKALIDTRIHQSVADGEHNIVFSRFESGVVRLYMEGTCSGCPRATANLSYKIKNILRHYVPEVKAVEFETDVVRDRSSCEVVCR
jgi:Fe-S cluster biogenesis protein NfuA